MKQIVLLLLFSFYLIGCTNRNNNRDRDLEKLLIESNIFEAIINSNQFYRYKNETDDNHLRNLPLFKEIEKFKLQVDSLISNLNRFYNDSISNSQNIDELIIKYNNLTDTLKKNELSKSAKSDKVKSQIVWKDYSKMKSTQSDKLIALEMIGNILRNEYWTRYQMFQNGDMYYDCIIIPQQKFNKIEKTKNNSYSLGLQSEQFMRCRIKYILIDTIYKDGKIVNLSHSVKLNNFFASINFDSLSKGSYKIIGKLQRNEKGPSGNEVRMDLFSDTFEIEK